MDIFQRLPTLYIGSCWLSVETQKTEEEEEEKEEDEERVRLFCQRLIFLWNEQ